MKNSLSKILFAGFAAVAVFSAAQGVARAGFIGDMFGRNSADSLVAASSRTSSNYSLKVSRSGRGVVISDDGKINCGRDCREKYSGSAHVTLKASPDAGYNFYSWGRDCSGTSDTCSVSVNKSKSVKAYFKRIKTGQSRPRTSGDGIQDGQGESSSAASTASSASSVAVKKYKLEVKKSGIGSVKSNPAGINCTSGQNNRDRNVCEAEFDYGQSVTLDAKPDVGSGYERGVWGGDCRNAGSSGTCTLTINKDRKATVSFDLNRDGYKLTVIKLGNGDGKVESMDFKGGLDGAISCGSDCSEDIKSGCYDAEGNTRLCTTVTLKATPIGESTFGWWGVDCKGLTGAKNECQIIMDKDREVTAFFNEGYSNQEGNDYKLTVSPRPSGGTIANRNGNGRIDCGTSTNNCSSNYGKDITVNLFVAPDSGYTFGNWGGACSGTSPECKVKMSQNRTVSAVFNKKVSSSSSFNWDDWSNQIINLPHLYIASDDNSPIAGEVSFTDKNGIKRTCSLAVRKAQCFYDSSYFNAGSEITLRARTKNVPLGSAQFIASKSKDCVISRTTGDNDTCKMTMRGSGDIQAVTVNFKDITNEAFGSSSSSSSSSSGGGVLDLKIREVLTGGRFGDYIDSLTLNNPNSEGKESIDLNWTVPSGASACAIAYGANAQPLRYGSLTSSQIIEESGKDRTASNVSKHNTEDYIVNASNKETATYTLSCRVGGSTVRDTASVTF
ncbi:MAG: hypothetical protein L6Q29_01715 [Candidatus Pacebacteria bacterium]|nr:hypothetical protein [Candidatus Paceibacterota bacterium]NUQ57311.1 hypothetical protein [Candidatus Paceibacter sp.]